jgi:hypothetical protein
MLLLIYMVKIGRYDYERSTSKNKKLMTIVNGKKLHFGDSRYSHYMDRTKIWSSKDTLDKKKRESYRKRHSAIKTKDGRLAISDPSQPAYHSLRVLWK